MERARNYCQPDKKNDKKKRSLMSFSSLSFEFPRVEYIYMAVKIKYNEKHP